MARVARVCITRGGRVSVPLERIITPFGCAPLIITMITPSIIPSIVIARIKNGLKDRLSPVARVRGDEVVETAQAAQHTPSSRLRRLPHH